MEKNHFHLNEHCKMGETQKEEQQHQQQQQQSQQPSSSSDLQQQLTSSTVSTVSIKLPQLWETNAAAWFVITEAQFSNAHITVDTTKYNYVISSLSNELAGKIIHVITNPPTNDKYVSLKNVICKLLEPSESSKAKELANLSGLGDHTPSQLLNHMRRLNGKYDETPLFKEMFLSQLPNHTRSILAICSEETSLTALADKADSIISFNDNICQIQANTLTTLQRKQLEESTNNQHYCFFHKRFGNKAIKCIQPCNYNQERRILHNVQGSGQTTNLLYVTDKSTNIRYLVDTGAEVSVFPTTQQDRIRTKPTHQLVAANGSSINAYGTRQLTININQQIYKFRFTIADVSKPIMGNDFLRKFRFAIDVPGKKLINIDNFRYNILAKSNNKSLSLHTITNSNSCQNILNEFPEILVFKSDQHYAKHDVTHFINTEGHPCHARSRRLSPEQLKIAKSEFKMMETKGIIRRSKSPWSSPLHMVKKPNGEYRPCGDYRQLNNKTVEDRYPVPHIQDFSSSLNGATIFSKIDLAKGYYQVPMNIEDIPKTAVITPFGLFEFIKMPFGLRNAAQTFQRLMDNIMQELDFIFV